MTRPTPRDVVRAIPGYRAGKPAIDDAHKLSSNENPYPPLPGVLERATAALDHANRYPDAGSTDLYEALRRRHGLPAERFAAGTGSVAVLFALLSAHCGPGDEVVYPWRSFEAYPIAVDLTGARSVRVPLRPDATHDLDAMLGAITDRTKVVVVCTPNNPTGPVVRHDDLVAFVDRVPGHVLVVVDEAYVEMVRDPAAARGVDLLDRSNVLVLRTFSKAYGLAGLRVGYAIAEAEVSASILKATPPFAVSSVAQAAAVASLDAENELLRRVDAIVAEREQMVAGLTAQGWDLPDTQANFVWFPVGDRALDLAAALDPVSVRPFDGDGVRVSVGDPAVNAELVERAGAWLAAQS